MGDFPSEDVLNKPSQIAASSQNTNYILSRVDIEELDVALRSVVQVARGNQAWGAQGNDGRLKKAPLFHPWGFQVNSFNTGFTCSLMDFRLHVKFENPKIKSAWLLFVKSNAFWSVQ